MTGASEFVFDLLLTPWHFSQVKRRAARRALVSAVDKQLKPRIRALGFASARTAAWRSSEYRSSVAGWGWIRMREGRVDLLDVYWEKYGRAEFQINYASQALEDWQAFRWGDSLQFGRALVGRRWGWHPAHFGRSQTPEKAVELAAIRLAQLDAYLRDGVQSRFVQDDKLPGSGTGR